MCEASSWILESQSLPFTPPQTLNFVERLSCQECTVVLYLILNKHNAFAERFNYSDYLCLKNIYFNLNTLFPWSPLCQYQHSGFRKKKNGVNALLDSTFCTFFHFGPYILFLPLLVSKPINTWHLSPYRQPTKGKSWGGRRNTLLTGVALMWRLKYATSAF